MSKRTPLNAATRARMVAYYEATAIEQGITAGRALYNASRITGNSAGDVDTLYGFPPGTAAAWVEAQGLPPLDGVPTTELPRIFGHQ